MRRHESYASRLLVADALTANDRDGARRVLSIITFLSIHSIIQAILRCGRWILTFLPLLQARPVSEVSRPIER